MASSPLGLGALRAIALMVASLSLACASSIGQDTPPAGTPKGCSPAELERAIAVLSPLFKPKGKPAPGEWLYIYKETGQSFNRYLKSSPEIPDATRSVMYIQEIGGFTPKQEEIIERTEELLSIFYKTPVKRLTRISPDELPAKAKRKSPSGNGLQLLSSFILDDLLPPRTPKDAAFHFAFSSWDLWPGEGWNFVFGQASTHGRVGVWSIYRFGMPDKGKEEFQLCLRRTLALALHEAGHAYSIDHCTAYECAMCGANSLEEADRGPMLFCPECMAKACWATKTPPVEKFDALRAFFERNGFKSEAEICDKAISALGKLR